MPLPPLAQRLSLFLFFFSVYAQITNLTIGQNDTSVHYSAGWRTSTHDGQPFLLVDVIDADVQITLPNGTVSFQYFGFKRSMGAVYSTCLDCGLETNGSMHMVDAHDPAENGTQPPVELFSMDNLDPTTVHSLTVFNFPDARFQNTGQLTFDHLIASVSDNATGQTMMQTTNPIASISSPATSSTTGTRPTSAPTSSLKQPKGTSSSGPSPASTASRSNSGGGGSSSFVGGTVTVSPTSLTQSTTAGVPSGISLPSAASSSTSTTSSSSATTFAAPSNRARLSTSVIAVVVVISVFVGLSSIFGGFVLLKIIRLRRQRLNGTPGPPVLPEMSIPGTINFPSFRTHRSLYSQASAGSGSTQTLEPDDSASFGPYQRSTSHLYIDTGTVSPAPVSPALPSSSMESWEDLERQRPGNPFESAMRSVSSDDVTQFMAQRSSNPFADMVTPERERLRLLSEQAWITRKPSQGQLEDGDGDGSNRVAH